MGRLEKGQETELRLRRNIPSRPLALLEGTARMSVFLRFAETSKQKRDVERIFLPTAISLERSDCYNQCHREPDILR